MMRFPPLPRCAPHSTNIIQVPSVSLTLLVSSYAKINEFSSLVLSRVGYVKALAKQWLLHYSVPHMCWTSLMFLQSVKILPCACTTQLIALAQIVIHLKHNAIPSQCRICLCLISVFINSGEIKFWRKEMSGMRRHVFIFF